MNGAQQFIATMLLLAAAYAIGYRNGHRDGASTRIVPLRPGAKRKPPLRAMKRSRKP